MEQIEGTLCERTVYRADPAIRKWRRRPSPEANRRRMIGMTGSRIPASVRRSFV